MAKKRKRKNPVNRIRRNPSFFRASESRTIEEYLFATVLTGVFTGLGVVAGNILAKYLFREVKDTVPLPESLHAVIQKEAG